MQAVAFPTVGKNTRRCSTTTPMNLDPSLLLLLSRAFHVTKVCIYMSLTVLHLSTSCNRRETSFSFLHEHSFLLPLTTGGLYSSYCSMIILSDSSREI